MSSTTALQPQVVRAVLCTKIFSGAVQSSFLVERRLLMDTHLYVILDCFVSLLSFKVWLSVGTNWFAYDFVFFPKEMLVEAIG